MYKFLLACALLFLLSACNGVDKFSILKKCTILGDESIAYARAHYVRLFYHYNPDKFEGSYLQIKNLEAVTVKNTIDTYTRAIDKLASDQKLTEDQITNNLLSSCKELSLFSTDFVEKYYQRALIHDSKNNPLSDDFFIELNQIVKFDHDIGDFDNNKISFKQTVENYKNAVKDYINAHRKHIPSDFVVSRLSK